MTIKREKELLNATMNILTQMENSPIVLNVLEAMVFYDEAECEGSFLVEDIINELNEEFGGKIETRGQELLKATAELFNKQEDSYYVLEILSETVFYDGAECDGSYLMEDIKEELDSINIKEELKKSKSNKKPKQRKM